MSFPEEIDQDIALFLSKLEELTLADKRELLRSMFKKHLVLNHGELVLTKYDFDSIVGAAKSNYSRDRIPKEIGGKTIDQGEAVNLFVIEATIGVLNQKGALNRLPKFDRR